MKVLTIFIDMLRPNLLHIYDEDNRNSKFDEEISKIGGVFFRNAYTPAPDTPRSHGCLWTSQYPINNGCDNRLKYPRYYIKDNVDNYVDILFRNGYSINIFMDPAMQRCGELPENIMNIANLSKKYDLVAYLQNLNIEENSYTHLAFNDFHQVVTDTYAQKKYVKDAYDISGRILETIRQNLDFDLFDLVIVYSDHGFQIREESLLTPLQMLDKARTQIFLLVKTKGHHELIPDCRLVSIMDIFSTILDFCQIQYQNDIVGINLLDENEHKWLLIEDHERFSVDIGLPVTRWGIRDNEGLAVMDYKLNWYSDYRLDSKKKADIQMLLSKYGTEYSENVKMEKIHKSYEKFLMDCPVHFDGTVRVKHRPFTLREMRKQVFKVIESIRTN